MTLEARHQQILEDWREDLNAARLPEAKPRRKRGPKGIEAEHAEYLHKAAAEDIPHREVAEAIGCSQAVVSRALRRLGYPPRDIGRKPAQHTRKYIDEWIPLREQGLTYVEISQRYGVTPEYVRQIIKKAGRPDLLGVRQAIGLVPYKNTCQECGRKTGSRNKTQTCLYCKTKHSDKRHVDIAQRCISLRLSGLSWRAIAERCGLSNNSRPLEYIEKAWPFLGYDEATWHELFPRKPLPKVTSFEQDGGAPGPGSAAMAGGGASPSPERRRRPAISDRES